MKIAINSQFKPSKGVGGVEYYVLSLIKALGQLNDGNEEYVIIGNSQNSDWLLPYLGPNQQLVNDRNFKEQITLRNQSKSRLKLVGKKVLEPLINRVKCILAPQSLQPTTTIPLSNGFYESLNCNIIHFPYQSYEITSLPSLFNPHDLQHVHFPQFFSPEEIMEREIIYAGGCQYSQKVVVGSSWIKDDIVRHYNLHPDKIQVISCAAFTQTYPDITENSLKEVRKEHNLPEKFIYYPAMTWEHKNHIRLIEAIDFLKRERNLKVELVCTGDKIKNHWPKIKSKLDSLNLSNQVHFLGLVPNEHVKAVYSLCEFVVVPTLFEAASGPIFEAWQEKKAVASSNVTSLPEQVGDTGLLFDPCSIESISKAIEELLLNENLRNDLALKGYERGKKFTWQKTAKTYRALYRLVGKMDLTPEDKQLLSHSN